MSTSTRRSAEDAAEVDAACAVVVVRRQLIAATLGEVDLRFVRVDDRVVALRDVGEVDARLCDLQAVDLGHGRDVAHEERRLPLHRHRVRRADDRTEPVGVDEPFVEPSATGEALLVEFSGRDHHLSELAVDHVTVDVDVPDAVERPDLLQLRVGRPQHRRVPEPDVVDRRLVGVDRLGVEIARCLERVHFDASESEGRVRGLDVVAVELTLLVELVRLHLEALHHRRVDPTDDDRSTEPESHRHQRQSPAAEPEIHEQDHGGDERNQDQQIERRHPGVHVRVERAERVGPTGDEQLPPVERVPDGFEQGDTGEEDRDVCLDRG
jgi:hypothetical protein